MNEFRYNACLIDCRNDVTYKYTPQPQNKANSCLLMKCMSTTIEAYSKIKESKNKNKVVLSLKTIIV